MAVTLPGPGTPVETVPGANGTDQRQVILAYGNGTSIEMVPTVTAGSYSAGFVMGGIIPFANILPPTFNAVLESITLKFKASPQTTEFDVAVFLASPAGIFTDHSAPVIAAADSALLTGIYPMLATSALSPLGTHTIYNLDGIAKQVNGVSTSLFVVVTSRSVPVALPSTSDMSLRLGVIW